MSRAETEIESKGYFVLCCRDCDDNYGEVMPLPFESAEARGKWAAAHTKGTGHNRWLVIDP